MGRMKEVYIDLLNSYTLPIEAEIADLKRINDLKMYEWMEYEKKQKTKKSKKKNEYRK